ncbi:hypothetical protein ACGFNU_05735 [Spirillospora sp. NPDC048911]|uniref:hypothetical protein n=1 Tax=Spirillospora sp. NPDC048911 TaxID=3364527 RepID=UPI00371356DD
MRERYPAWTVVGAPTRFMAWRAGGFEAAASTPSALEAQIIGFGQRIAAAVKAEAEAQPVVRLYVLAQAQAEPVSQFCGLEREGD